jgi:MFS transporter, OFA family, oxalate/formate antiporter
MIDIKPRVKSNFSWGWIIVAAATLMTLGFYGASGSFGVFLKPIEDALHVTRTLASSIMSTFMVFTGITGIICGWLTDKYGPRIVIGVGTIVGSSGYFLASQANSLWQLQLSMGVLAGASMGTCFAPLIATTSKWFSGKQRVLSVGILTAGIALGQMSLPVLIAHLIASSGWHPAFIILAIEVLITAVPAFFLMGKRPSPDINRDLNQISLKSTPAAINDKETVAREWSPGQVIRTTPFWMFFIMGFVTALGFYILMVHIVAYATDLGIVDTDAALILTFVNIGIIISLLLVWNLVRKISNQFALVIVFGLQAVALFLLMRATSFFGLAAMGLLYGIGFGGSNTVRLATIPEVFGTKSAGVIIGMASVAWSIGGIIGPILAGYIFDISHSYNVAFLVGGLLMIVGALNGSLLKTPDKKRL